MPEIKINIAKVMELSDNATQIRSNLSDVKYNVRNMKYCIDDKILNRNNINNKFNSIYNAIGAIEARVAKINNTVENGAYRYIETDKKLSKKGNEVEAKAVSSTSISSAALEFNRIGRNYVNDKTDKREDHILDIISRISGNIGHFDGVSRVCATPNMLSLFESFTNLENALYDYFGNNLNPFDMSRLANKFGKSMVGIAIAGSIANVIKNGIDTYNVFSNPYSTGYDKAGQVVDMGGSIFTSGGNIYIATQAGKKYLRFVNTSGVKNQILYTPELKFTNSAELTKKLSTVATVVAIGDVVASTTGEFIRTYGNVSHDGFVDMGDFGELGIRSSVKGLTSVLNTVTFGLSDALFNVSDNANKVSSGIINFASTAGVDFVESHTISSAYVQNAQFMKDYANNPENNIICRGAVSVVSGVGMLGAMTLDAGADCAKWIGNGISSGWNSLKSLFS